MAHQFGPNFMREVSSVKCHISQCKIAKNLGLSPTTTRSVVKKIMESREITVHVGQDRKPLVNVLDL